MQFLLETDFDVQIMTMILNIQTNEDPLILDNAESASISEMISYLSTRYNTEEIFAATGDDRHRLIVMYLVDMVIYHTGARNIPKQNIELRGIRYEAAINWLNKVNKGLLNPDLPKLTDENGNTKTTFRWGSQPLRSR
ncbi:phage protein Gp36 family protein [Bernardetia sp. Wsw4-3y2]|uniref:phage protein Gp36 family protein n=1 Tax=Bernardetia sp. Wsw4-3y2 TaxID=3127471 RepID=UPI0030D41B47